MAAPKPRVPITPATKVADLLESWPVLEEVLVAQAPGFRRLKSPVLRRTVARVATLEQAAGVGGLAVRELVAALRRAAGVEEDAASGQSAAPAGPESPPDWLDLARVVAGLTDGMSYRDDGWDVVTNVIGDYDGDGEEARDCWGWGGGYGPAPNPILGEKWTKIRQ